MTREEFTAQYAERSSWSTEDIAMYFYAMPCVCGEDFCQGWKMLSHLSIADDEGLEYCMTNPAVRQFELARQPQEQS